MHHKSRVLTILHDETLSNAGRTFLLKNIVRANDCAVTEVPGISEFSEGWVFAENAAGGIAQP